MKKLPEFVSPQIDVAAELAQVKARLATLEAIVEKHHPTPKLEVLQPYPIGSTVYSVADLAASYPFVVQGYDSAGRIVVQHESDIERAFSLQSVVPLSKCPNANPTPEQLNEQLYGHLDAKTREFYLGRKKAQLEAVTGGPAGPVIPKQWRYRSSDGAET